MKATLSVDHRILEMVPPWQSSSPTSYAFSSIHSESWPRPTESISPFVIVLVGQLTSPFVTGNVGDDGRGGMNVRLT